MRTLNATTVRLSQGTGQTQQCLFSPFLGLLEKTKSFPIQWLQNIKMYGSVSVNSIENFFCKLIVTFIKEKVTKIRSQNRL